MQPRIAVVAHAGKSLGGGLPALRQGLRDRGVEPAWFEVPKSRKVPEAIRRALRSGAKVVLAWGGDGTIQRAVDTLAGSTVELAILPAGTGNLLARNLGIPIDLDGALDVALRGRADEIGTGTLDGEHFAVMAGAGLDAMLVEATDDAMKEHLGRVGYVLSGIRAVVSRAGASDDEPPSLVRANVKVDGVEVFDGDAATIVAGNVAELTAGMTAFPGADPRDGMLRLAIVTATGPVDWTRTVARSVAGDPADSPFVVVHEVRDKATVRFAERMPYQLDGGQRGTTKRLRFRVRPRSVRIRVPLLAVAAAVLAAGASLAACSTGGSSAPSPASATRTMLGPVEPLPATIPLDLADAVGNDRLVRESWEVLLDDARARQHWAVGIDAAFLKDDLSAYAARANSIIDPSSSAFLADLPKEDVDTAVAAAAIARRSASLAARVASRCQTAVRGPVPAACTRAIQRLDRSMDDLLELASATRAATSASPGPS